MSDISFETAWAVTYSSELKIIALALNCMLFDVAVENAELNQ